MRLDGSVIAQLAYVIYDSDIALCPFQLVFLLGQTLLPDSCTFYTLREMQIFAIVVVPSRKNVVEIEVCVCPARRVVRGAPGSAPTQLAGSCPHISASGACPISSGRPWAGHSPTAVGQPHAQVSQLRTSQTEAARISHPRAASTTTTATENTCLRAFAHIVAPDQSQVLLRQNHWTITLPELRDHIVAVLRDEHLPHLNLGQSTVAQDSSASGN